MTPKDFRRERLKKLRNSVFFVEIMHPECLSLSGAIESGYIKALRDLAARTPPHLWPLLNSYFPARVFQGYHRNIVVMLNETLITTLYKRATNTDYALLLEEGVVPGNLEKILEDFPGITMLQKNDTTGIRNFFSAVFRNGLLEHQTIVQQQANTLFGLAADESDYSYRPPLKPNP